MINFALFADLPVLLLEGGSSRVSLEFLFLLFFGLGFWILHSGSRRLREQTRHKKNKEGKQADRNASCPSAAQWNVIEVEAKKGDFKCALAAWRSLSAKDATPAGMFRYVTEAFVLQEKENLVPEVMAHIRANKGSLLNKRVAASLLEQVARAGEYEIMGIILTELVDVMKLEPDMRMYEMLLGGYAAAGKAKEVNDIIRKIRHNGLRVTNKGFSLSIKGFLKNGMADEALKQTLAMKQHGHCVPHFAVTQILRLACEESRGEEFFVALENAVPLPADAICLLFAEICSKQGRMEFADRIEAWARRSSIPVSSGAFDWLLRHWAGQADSRASSLFEEMCNTGVGLSDGLLVGLLGRCAESKNVDLAQRIISFAKQNNRMNIVLYSALMKVYVMAGMPDMACDIYDEVIAQGLEPDVVMYSCLTKFAVECGRTDMAANFMKKVPSLEVQNYMTLLRTAGRDGDVDKAMSVLKILEESHTTVELPAYNCVLDVCISAGQFDRARQLLKDMRKLQDLDVITWNTLLKGCCMKGDVEEAKATLLEMEADGVAPDDISFNAIINTAVSTGNFPEAWKALDMMKDRGIKPTEYTLSILMKFMRKGKDSDPDDVARALETLDRSGIDVFTDHVLLNTVLEVSMRHRDHNRLHAILERVKTSDMTIAIQTYSALIKAAGILRRPAQCKDLWQDMTCNCHIEPDKIALGCFVEALVNNRRFDDAVKILDEWQTRVPVNEYIFGSLIKGYAQSKQPEQALAMYHRARESGSKMTVQIYNWVIDAQASLGAMDVVSSLVEAMCEDGLVPDGNTNINVIKGYCVKGDLASAMQVFKSLQDRGDVKDSCIYNILLHACARHAQSDIALVLVRDMETRNIAPPKFMLSALVKLFARHGQTEEAVRIVKTWPAQQADMEVTPQLWSHIISGYTIEGSPEKAAEVLRHVKKSTPAAQFEAKIYGSLISAFVRQGNLKEALAILDDAHGLGLGQQLALAPGKRMDVESIHALVRAVQQRQGSAAADTLIRRDVAGVPLAADSMGFCSHAPWQGMGIGIVA